MGEFDGSIDEDGFPESALVGASETRVIGALDIVGLSEIFVVGEPDSEGLTVLGASDIEGGLDKCKIGLLLTGKLETKMV